MKTARVGAVHNATARMPVAGKIRPGIKVLTAKAAAIDGMKDIYSQGVSAGASFDDIEKHLRQVKGCPQYPLSPKNSPHFRALQSDFTTPGAAQTIMDLYGEQRDGDEEPQLYSFPVVFPSDDLDIIFRETFEAWKASELHRWSEPDPKTGELQCTKRADIDPKAKRRRFGGRGTERVGPCDPNACDLFGAGHCKHVGSLYFWIPGVVGVGLISLTFTSIYASLDIAEKINFVKAGLGHVKGTNAGKAIFRITKTADTVSRVDWATGKASRSKQWIIRLEADIDMVSVLGGDLPAQPALVAPKDQELLGTEPDVTAEPAPEDHAVPDPAPAPEDQAQPNPAAAAIHITELRKDLGVMLKILAWPDAELEAWLGHNGYEKQDLRNEGKLQEIIRVLTPIVRQEMTGAQP